MSVDGVEVLDGLAATVGSRVITLSDLRLARDLQLVAPGTSEEAALTAVIDRTLMLVEVERFQPPDPPETAVDMRLNELKARLNAGEWERAIVRNGVDEAHIRALLRDTLRLESYLRQRFETLARPSDEEVKSAYEQRRQRGSAGGLPPFDQLQERLHEELRGERFDTLVAGWVAELRSRGEVSVRGR
jgi:hypothetical protein